MIAIAIAVARSFSVGGGINDLYLMLGVGVCAWAMIEMKYPIAPLVIGVSSAGDDSLRRALLVSDGDLLVFLSRPASAILLAANLALIMAQFSPMRRILGRNRHATDERMEERNG